MIYIKRVQTPADVEQARLLFEEYGNTRPGDPALAALASEITSLPGEYAPPGGSLLLAMDGETVAGCVAVRTWAAGIAEMKRLFVRPGFRGKRVGYQLALAIIEEARRLGHRCLRLDTIPGMDEAQALYRQLGFHEIPAYRYNPNEYTKFFEIPLTDEPQNTPNPAAREKLKIGIIGDFQPGYRKHETTSSAILETAQALGLQTNLTWFDTPSLAVAEKRVELAGCDGICAAPSSPYRNLEGGLAAICLAREAKIPFLATCGGFQHTLLEFARNVAHLKQAESGEYNPEAKEVLLTLSACSPVDGNFRLSGKKKIQLSPHARVAKIYGQLEVEEEFACNYELNQQFQEQLTNAGLKVTGTTEGGDVRVVELIEHPFFVATAYLPQWSSSEGSPHPLFTAFLNAARLTSLLNEG